LLIEMYVQKSLDRPFTEILCRRERGSEEKHPMDTRAQLIERSIPFLAEIRNRTPGNELESWLNTTHGPQTPLFGDLARLVTAGVQEGWAANVEIAGPNYRRSLIAPPTDDLHHFSITAVYYNSIDPYRGQYHQHPYGEVNLIVPISPGAEMMGP